MQDEHTPVPHDADDLQDFPPDEGSVADQTGLPQDLDAERAVLASVLVDQRQLDAVRSVIKATDFFDARHQRIFEAFCALHDDAERKSIDLLTVSARLKQAGQLAAAGGAAYLGELMEGVARSANAREYARLVRDHSLRRALQSYGHRVASEAVGSPPRETIASAQKVLTSIAEGAFSDAPVPITEELNQIVAEAEKERLDFPGIRTGFPDLDELMGGLRKSDLILIGGRPGDGKTSLGLNIALNAGLKGKQVLVFSLEMPLRQIVTRLLFSHARVDASVLQRPGLLSKADRKRLRNVLPVLQKIPIHVDDSNVTPVELRSKALQLARELVLSGHGDGLDLVVVDYLQLMRGAEPGGAGFENRNLEVAEISRSLKLLAKDLGAPILALSQLNRAPERRNVSQPELADLRESGALEQDADVVLLIHNERRRNEGEGEGEDGVPSVPEPPKRRIIVAKNRNGATGHRHLVWLGQLTRFFDEKDYEQNPLPHTNAEKGHEQNDDPNQVADFDYPERNPEEEAGF